MGLKGGSLPTDLQLFSSASPTESELFSLRRDRLCLCVVARSGAEGSEIEAVGSELRRIQKSGSETLEKYAIAVGGKPLWADSWPEARVLWTGSRGIQLENCGGLLSTATWVLFLVRGLRTVHRFLSISTELQSLLTAQTQSYESLADKISSGDSSDLIALYATVRSEYSEFAQEAVRTLLEALTALFGLDLTAAGDCFERCRWGTEGEDVLDPRDITLKQFLRRLRNFCLFQPPASPRLPQPSPNELSLQAKIASYEAELAALRVTIQERNEAITHLQRELREATALKSASESKPVVMEASVREAVKHSVTVTEEAKDEFWQEKESDRFPRSPSFQEIAQQKFLWITSTQVPWRSPQYCAASVLSKRPSPLKNKRKSPPRLTPTKKAVQDRHIFRSTGKMVFGST